MIQFTHALELAREVLKLDQGTEAQKTVLRLDRDVMLSQLAARLVEAIEEIERMRCPPVRHRGRFGLPIPEAIRRHTAVVLAANAAPKPTSKSGEIDVMGEWGKERRRAEVLESAARILIDSHDAHLLPDGSVSCLRFVNTEAMKALIEAVGQP